MTTTCAEHQDALDRAPADLLEPGDRAALEAHLAGCVACRERADRLAGAWAGLDPGPAPLPAGGRDRLVARLAAEEAARRGGAVGSPVSAAAGEACAACAAPVGRGERVVALGPAGEAPRSFHADCLGKAARRGPGRLACEACRVGLGRGAAIFCAACLAPHHRECLAEGGCAACGETAAVEAAPPRRRASRLAAGLALVATGAVAAMAVDRVTGPPRTPLVAEESHHAPQPGPLEPPPMVLDQSYLTAFPITGAWDGWAGNAWGDVFIVGGSGLYSQNHGTGQGRLSVRPVDVRTFAGTWAESTKRHGTMRLVLSEDGLRIDGEWRADDDCAIGPGESGRLVWHRRPWPRSGIQPSLVLLEAPQVEPRSDRPGRADWSLAGSWSVEVAASAPPVPRGEHVLIPAGDQLLERDGEGRAELSTAGAGPVTVGPDGAAYVAAGGLFRCFGPDHRLRWELDLQAGPAHVPPALSPDGKLLYVSGEALGLAAIDPVDGRLLWTQRDHFGAARGRVRLGFDHRGRLLAFGQGQGLFRIWPENGAWWRQLSLEVTDGLVVSPAKDAAPVLVAWAGRLVHGLEPDEHAVRWTASLPGDVAGAVAHGHQVVVALRSGDLVGLSPRDGRTVWRQPVSTRPLGAPATSGVDVVVLDEGLVLHAVWPSAVSTGPRRLQVQGRAGPATRAVAGADGRVYVATTEAVSCFVLAPR